MEDILKKVLNHFLLALQINEVVRQKNNSVRIQDFEAAVKYRNMEVELSKEIAGLEELSSLRDQLNQPQ